LIEVGIYPARQGLHVAAPMTITIDESANKVFPNANKAVWPDEKKFGQSQPPNRIDPT
jgi:hypothetical protein